MPVRLKLTKDGDMIQRPKTVLRSVLLGAVLSVGLVGAAGQGFAANDDRGWAEEMRASVTDLLPRIDWGGRLDWPAFSPLVGSPERLQAATTFFGKVDATIASAPFGVCTGYAVLQAIMETEQLAQARRTGVYPDATLAEMTAQRNERWRNAGIGITLEFVGSGAAEAGFTASATAVQWLGIGSFVLTVDYKWMSGDLRTTLARGLGAFDAVVPRRSVIVMIDSSQSMGRNDPQNLRASAVRMIAAIAAPSTRVALVDFDSRVNVRL